MRFVRVPTRDTDVRVPVIRAAKAQITGAFVRVPASVSRRPCPAHTAGGYPPVTRPQVRPLIVRVPSVSPSVSRDRRSDRVPTPRRGDTAHGLPERRYPPYLTNRGPRHAC